ncbi:TIGR03668 family PPOX class F420-dependent oxidoreductase [Nonomuraea zeae]|uniref:TIGR03668 family PPOX class F420-dependent oxidoreductase n=1 Tax=Nonomuraea zeae TaxID=1642303 RepID=A0A5S4G211_9ACTN|nr:TIGR03668 family PPOX class F420-dependent oxidoreductase [Nonomuraea zeae]TMR26564.1 TIGR03668 family PPOX class F420-dependent oxidoreductase [Nonomuraea zeae]
MDAAQARARFAGARVARLATVGESGAPRLVPVTFAVQGDEIVTAVDHKPKRTTDLRRLRDIRHEPRVSVLADHYDDDWAQLWWARADGTASVHESGPVREAALRALAGKYPQYARRVPGGAVIVIAVSRWSGWSYTG